MFAALCNGSAWQTITVGEQSPTVGNEHNRCGSRALPPHWAEMRRR